MNVFFLTLLAHCYPLFEACVNLNAHNNISVVFVLSVFHEYSLTMKEQFYVYSWKVAMFHSRCKEYVQNYHIPIGYFGVML